jgi:hypothetical protein
MKKRQLIINGDLQKALLQGSAIVRVWNSEHYNTVLTKLPKGSEWRFQVWETLSDISDNLLLASSNNFTPREAEKKAEEEHYSQNLYAEKHKKAISPDLFGREFNNEFKRLISDAIKTTSQYLNNRELDEFHFSRIEVERYGEPGFASLEAVKRSKDGLRFLVSGDWISPSDVNRDAILLVADKVIERANE